jgi:hypothetical protein
MNAYQFIPLGTYDELDDETIQPYGSGKSTVKSFVS